MPKIIIKKNQLLVKKISIPEEVIAFTVGSEQGNDILVEDEKVSFFHLQFEKQNGEYYVRDLQSQNGTFVNGRKISGRTSIHDHDEVGLGIHKLTFLNPKGETKTRFITESYPRSGSAANESVEHDSQKWEQRMAGVPTLTNLNSWLKDDDQAFDKKADFYVENNGSDEEPPADFIPAIGNESTQTFLETRPPASPNPQLTFVESDNRKEAILDFDTESITRPPLHPASKSGADSNGRRNQDLSEPPAIHEQTPARVHYLIGINGYYLGRKFRLRYPDTRIGRDGKVNDIVIKKNSRGKIDQSVSRRHATISYRNGKYFLIDKRSKSRTYLNQRKLEPSDNVEIHPGDEIEIVSDRQSHILRMVAEGDWDFSFPRKAGAWHVRHRLQLIGFYSLLLLALSALVFLQALTTRNLIADKPEPLMISEAVWLASAGKTAADSSGNALPLSAPAIADFNGDRFFDFIYADPNGALVCFDGQAQKPAWTVSDFQVNPDAPITVEDLNNDGRPDIVVVSKDLRVRALDGRLGIEISKSPILAGPLIAPPAVGDFNKDGLRDIAITSEANAIYIGYSGLRNARWLKLEIDGPISSVISTADLYGDGAPKIIVGTETGKIVFLDGGSQKVLGEININEEFSKATGSFGLNHPIRYPAAIGELNGDRTPDIVVLTHQGGVMALHGATLERLWYELPDSSDGVENQLNQNLLLGDLDGDNLLDVLVRTPGGRLRAFKGSGQSKDRKMMLWEKSDTYYATFPALADFNKNGALDVVASDISGQLYIIEGATGDVLWKNGMPGASLIGPPLIADLDNDHRLDIAVFKADGQVYKLATNSVTASSAPIWTQIFGNSKNTNSVVPKRQDIRISYAAMLGAILLMAAVLAGNYFLRKQRRDLARA